MVQAARLRSSPHCGGRSRHAWTHCRCVCASVCAWGGGHPCCLTPPLGQDFYFRNSDSPNGVLFEKQQMALRKLLHEFDAIAGHVRRVRGPRRRAQGSPFRWSEIGRAHV